MIIGDRRRPGLPGELVARLVLIWVAVALLQGLGVAADLWLSPAGAAPGFISRRKVWKIFQSLPSAKYHRVDGKGTPADVRPPCAARGASR